jgi:hypothetical protein
MSRSWRDFFSADAGGLLEWIPVLVGFKHLVLLGSEAIVVEVILQYSFKVAGCLQGYMY